MIFFSGNILFYVKEEEEELWYNVLGLNWNVIIDHKWQTLSCIGRLFSLTVISVFCTNQQRCAAGNILRAVSLPRNMADRSTAAIIISLFDCLAHCFCSSLSLVD